MKKLFTFLSLLIVSGMISPALAATSYDLYVAGIHVTSDNASKITGTGISGTVSYDNSSKTLTLTSATITSANTGIYNYGIDGLKIVISGTCSITSDFAGILCYKTTTIKGEDFYAELTTQGSATNCGIWGKNCEYIYIEDLWLNASGGYGIYGGDSDTTIPILTVRRSNVYANASKDGISCIQGFQKISVSGSTYDYNGYKYDTTKKQHLNSSGTVTKSFTIRPRIAIGRYIWDSRFDATISSSTVAASVKSGTFSYDSNTRTLTMDNVSMSAGYVPIRYYGAYGGGDLNIKVKGTNQITMLDGAGVECIYSNGYGVSITGDDPTSSRLTLNNKNCEGINLYSYSGTKNLNIKDVTLRINSTTENKWSIDGGGTTALTVENSEIIAHYGIKGITSCTLNGSFVSTGGEYNATLKGFSSDGTNLTKGDVVILVGYDLAICGTRVTQANKSDIFGDGKASFNSNSNTLYLKNFSKTYDYECISNRIENLWIRVSGGASLTSLKNHAIFSKNSFKISSDDFSDVTLQSKTSKEGYCGIYIYGEGTVTIEKVWLSVYAPMPLLGKRSENPKLDLNLCYLYASSTDNYYPCVYGFKEISTTGVIYNYNGSDYNTTNTRMERSDGSIHYAFTFHPRLCVKKFIFDPRYSATIDKSIAGVTSGDITYSGYTLTLDNATIDAGRYRGIQYFGPYNGHDLTIKVKGTNTVNSVDNTSNSCIHCNNNNLTISGEGYANSRLTLNNKNYNNGISFDGDKTLTIKDMRLDVTGTEQRSISSNWSGQLLVSNSNVYASYGISGFADCTLDACYFSSPSYETTYSTSLKGVTSDGSKVYDGFVAISQGYRLFIAGTQVTKANAANITGTGISGTVSYNSTTKTLTLKNAEINTSESGISNYNIDGLTILVDGDGMVESTAGYGIYSDKSATITSNNFSTLKVNCTNTSYSGIRMGNRSNLRVEAVWLYVEGGYALQGTSNGNLELDRCYVNVFAKKSGGHCVYGFKGIETYGVTYDYNGATYSNGRLTKDEKLLNYHVMMPRISVGKYIWNVRNNATINSSSPGAGITSGSMSYTSADHKLTLNGITMNPGVFTGIQFYGAPDSNDGLTVAVKGNNNINYSPSMNADAFRCYDHDLNITGDGKASSTLNINNTYGMGINLYNKDLNISNVKLNVTGTQAWSIAASGNAKFNINDSEVTANKRIDGFTALNMKGCAIAEPEDAYFSTSLKGITTDGISVYEGKVVIKDVSYGINIGETEVKSSNADDILGNGQFSYDPGTKTLTVKNAKLENAGTLGSGIYNRSIDGLKIDLQGNSTITSRNCAIGSEKSFSITGDGTLELNTTSDKGIYFASGCTDCTIDGPTITVNAAQTAIYDAANGTTLTVKNPSTRIVLNPAKGYVTVSNLKAMQFFDDQRVIRPAGTFMSSALKGLTQDGTSLLKRKVTIASKDPADVNKDRIVDVADIGAVISVMSGTDMTHAATADVNGDTTVDVADIAAIVTAMSEMSRQQKAGMEE